MGLKINKVDEKGDLISTSSQSTPQTKQSKGKRTLPRSCPESIVMYLATGYSPSEIRTLIKDEFGIEVSGGVISYYDPRHIAGAKLKQDLKDLFYSTHRKFIENLQDIPIAHAATRLRYLNAVVNKGFDSGDYKSIVNAVKESRIEMVEYQRADTPQADTPENKESSDGE
jgi:hypothetical protein